MMRVTNGMMMTNTKGNINRNKVSVDRLNTQMTTQKKITKPSDNPLIAIKSLRLGTTLSQIHQYYDNNIKDAQSWMDVTETALSNMKNIITEAYRLSINGATDTLTEDDRKTILSQFTKLSDQLYAEANADYAERTVFAGYKTNETVAFTSGTEAAAAKYEISERFSFSDIEEKSYYANAQKTPTASTIQAAKTSGVNDVEMPQEEILSRARLGYNSLDKLSSINYSCDVETTAVGDSVSKFGKATITTEIDPVTGDNEQSFKWTTQVGDSTFIYSAGSDGKMQKADFTDINGYTLSLNNEGYISFDATKLTAQVRNNSVLFKDGKGDIVFTLKNDPNSATPPLKSTLTDALGNSITINPRITEAMIDVSNPGIVRPKAGPMAITSLVDTQGNTVDATKIDIKNKDGNDVLEGTTGTGGSALVNGNFLTLNTADKGLSVDMKVLSMSSLEYEGFLSDIASGAQSLEDYKDIAIYLPDTGEIVFANDVKDSTGANVTTLKDNLISERASLEATYDKNGFEKGEVRPEMYYDCIKKTDNSKDNWIVYDNYDEAGNWIYQNIDYAVSANQDLTVNTQINSVINSDMFRDMQEMIDVVQKAIDAHALVSNIEDMMKMDQYQDADSQAYLTSNLRAAQKQADYFDDNLHKVFSKEITNFEAYLNKINLAITDIGGRGDQLDLAENRMSDQQVTFKELMSNNEDAELSDISIDYTSAYNAFKASLQAAGRIDDMSLLDYL